MSLLETLDGDIADLLGSDNEQPSSIPRPSHVKGEPYKQKISNGTSTENYDNPNTESEIISLTEKKTKIKQSKMLHSQSNRSLPSTQISMSREEALSLLQSESNSKPLTSTTSITKLNTKSITKQSNSSHDSDDFDFPSAPSPLSQNNIRKNESLSASDDDSNDSILDWLDEPQTKTQKQRRKSLLPKPAKAVESTNKRVESLLPKPAKTVESTNTTESLQSSPVTHKTETETETQQDDIRQSNLKTDEKTMPHPPVESTTRESDHEIRMKYNHLLLNEQRNIKEMNNKTEILLNEQRVRLNQSHRMEIGQLQKEKDELRALNSTLMNSHQTELINLEEHVRKNGLSRKQHTMNEIQLVEERARKEIAHQMELNRATMDELKKQHLNEIEILNNMHSKQLQNFRKQNKNESQMNLLITKMETSTLNLHRLQKDIEIEREGNQKERENKISMKEKVLNEKNDELIRERKAHRELIERFQAFVQETKLEKTRVRENDDKLKKRQERLLCELTDNNREIHIQRDVVNEERRKFELSKNRWNKQKEDEMDDIQRLKNDHTQSIQSFYEEQEIERSRLAKQRQIIGEDKARFMKMKKEFDVEQDVLDTNTLQFEQKKHSLEIEKSKFERKVQDVTSLSHRVYQQSELVRKMYNDSKNIEHENGMIRMELTGKTKELKMMKQQILIEKNQMENERKMLEEEQLSLLTTKRDLLQQMDSIHHIKSAANAIAINQEILPTKKYKNHSLSINKINSELKELKDFVNQCKYNISNYKTDLTNLKYKRESIKSLSSTNHSSHFNTLRMSFPSFSTKSSSISRSIHSLSSTMSAKNIDNYNNNNKDKKNGNDMNNTIINTITPIISKQKRNNNINILNNTDNTLQSSFVSMVNIDTPITIDKTKKYMNKRKEQDPTLPLTPTPMPNLSRIKITEEDNEDFHNSDDDEDECY